MRLASQARFHSTVAHPIQRGMSADATNAPPMMSWPAKASVTYATIAGPAGRHHRGVPGAGGGVEVVESGGEIRGVATHSAAALRAGRAKPLRR